MILVISMVMPYGLEGMYSISNENAKFSTSLNESDTIVYAGSMEGLTGSGNGGQSSVNAAGGSAIEKPFDVGWRISLTRDPDFKYYSDAATGKNARENLWESLRQAYPSNYSNSVNVYGIYILGSRAFNVWKPGRDAIMYHVSLSKMNYNKDVHARVIKRGSTANPGGKGFMYDQIYNMIKQPNGRATLKSQIDTLFGASAKGRALNVWSYITDNTGGKNLNYQVNQRFNQVFHHSGTDWYKFEEVKDDQALIMTAEMIDVLASCYALAPDSGTKSIFRAALVDYIDGADLKEKPIGITLEPLFMLSYIRSHGRYYIMTMQDLMHLYAGVHSSVRVNEDTAKPLYAEKAVRGNWKAEFRESVDWSLAHFRQTVRASSEFYVAGGSASAMKWPSWDYTYRYFSTTSGRAEWKNVQNKSNMMQLAVYLAPTLTTMNKDEGPGHMWGMVLIPFGNPGATTQTLGKIQAEPDNRVIDTKTLGVPVEVKLFFGTDKNDDKNAWKTIADKAASNGATFTIEVKTNRINSPYGAAQLEDLVLAGVTPEQLKSYIEGEMLGSVYDNVAGYASPDVAGGADPMVVFDYKSDFKVTTTYGGQTYEYVGVSEDPASFVVLPERLGYTSEPEAYCELKNYAVGSNMSGKLSEEWEAMAGVPSTEQLYFAAGGSEFIVDVHVEYVKDEVARRTYDSYFTQVNCEFFNGDNSKTHTLGGVTVNTHTGGGYVAAKKWDGSNPCTTTYSSCCCGSQYVTGHSIDTSPFQAALAEATAYAAEINSTVLFYTDSSHDQYREHAGWSASPDPTTNDGFHGSAGKGGSCCGGGHSCSGHGKEGKSCGPSSCSAGSPCPNDHTWHIEVPFTVPSHILCGPCCDHIIPETHDTWAQTWKYDSLKISNVHVWQIDQAAVEGLDEIIGPSVDVDGSQYTLNDGVVHADIRCGRPSIFYNIALKNDAKMVDQDGRGNATGTSKAGRVRYNLAGAWKDAEQHDEVTWNLGSRKNTCDGLSKTEANTVAPSISGNEHSEPKGKGFTYHSFKPNPSSTGAVTRFTSATTGVASIGQQNWPTNEVGFLQAHTDATDQATEEYKKFLEKREQSMQAYMITDFLILQTSAGDQSVIYFDKANPAGGKITAESEIPELNVVVEEMWHNNNNSAAEWLEDHINVGSYNGKYSRPSKKFKWNNQGAAPQTLFDRFGNPAKTIYRPEKPKKNMMLYNGELNIILEDTNQHYETGMTEVFWANILHWTDVSSEYYTVCPTAAPYSTTDKMGDWTEVEFSNYCALENAGNAHATPATDLNAARGFAPHDGFIMEATYSKEHEKINDIIVHDPVSTENVALISLPDERDQRYGQVIGAEYSSDLDNSLRVCPGEPGTCDFRVLNCTYFKDVTLGQYDFDTLDSFGNPINKVTKNGIVLPSGFSLASKITGSSLYSSSGVRLAIPFTELDIKYTPALRVKAEMDVNLTSLASTQMIASLGSLGLYVDSSGKIGYTTGNGDYRYATNITLKTNKTYHIEAIFSFFGPSKCELKVGGTTATFNQTGAEPKELSATTIGNTFNIGSMGISASYGLRGYVDNLTITRLAGSAEHSDECYTSILTHPNGLNYHEHTRECVDDNSYTKDYATQTKPHTVTLTPGKYIFEVWGASGGGLEPNGTRGSVGGKGGYATATYEITEEQKVYVYVGGAGSASTAMGTGGGIMGGGHGGPSGYGGGGMSYISTSGTDTFTPKVTTYQEDNGYWQPDPFAAGATILGNDDDGGSGLSSKLYVNLTKGTKYIFCVGRYSASRTGSYPWSITAPSGTTVASGTFYCDEGTWSSKTFDPDCTYTFTATESGRYRFDASANGGDPCTYVSTYAQTWVPNMVTKYKLEDSVKFDHNKVLILAGGGGGADNATTENLGAADDGSGGNGGGTNANGGHYSGVERASGEAGGGGTQSTGYKRGLGESVTANTDTGGGGAGWYGGKATNYGDGGAGGGSGYIKPNTFVSSSMENGKNWGNGKVRITRVSNIEEVVKDVVNGKYTDQQMTEMFGDALAGDIVNAARGSLLHTWSGWTTTKHYGFKAYPNSGTGVTMNGNLVLNIKPNVVEVQVPVNFAAGSVRQVRVYFNNNTTATTAGLFINGQSTPVYVPIKANTNNQVAVFNVADTWKGKTITSLDFDVTSGTPTGTATVTKIEVYGPGKKTANTGNQSTTGTPVSVSTTFSYKASEQTITLEPGTYTLEVWGASGGQSPHGTGGGKGGYGKGTYTVSKTTPIYIHTGGQGYATSGGYNGGGASKKSSDSAYGGGATHIATASGLLKDLSGNKDAVLIVAGGGGAAGCSGYGGGAGGGVNQNGGAGTGSGSYGATGPGGTTTGVGTQRSGTTAAGFGYGGYSSSLYNSGAGGGGYYGGQAGNNVSGGGASGGGGSGYANPNYISAPSGTSGTWSGDGKVVITGTGTKYVESGSTLQITGGTPTDAVIQDVMDTITSNWQKIPYWLGDREGVWNPVWTCQYLPLNVHRCDWKCHEELILRCSEPHHQNTHYDGSNSVCWDACHDDAKHKNFKDVINTTDGTFTPGNFINLDWGFKIYFPNLGDFDQGEPYGIKQLTSTRGLGFVDNMDTTKWTRVKRVKFPVNVIRNGVLYRAGEWITLSDYGEYAGMPGEKYDESLWSNYDTELFEAVNGDMINGKRNHIYQFYCVEANSEFSSAEVTVEVEAVNCPGENDNQESPTNRKRYSTFKALHGGTNTFYMDVVGRIGNLIMEDTGDYRFSNLFKQTIEDEPADSPTTHSLISGTLEIYNGAVIDSNQVTAQKAGAGASVNNLTLAAGQYKVTVNGDKLNNGKLNITTQSGWVVDSEYTQENGLSVTEEKLPVEGSTETDTKFTVAGPGFEMAPGKYRLEVYGQGFQNVDWKLQVHNPKSDTYTDYTAKAEHVGTTGEKTTFIIELDDGVYKNEFSDGMEIYCETRSNPGFIVDRLVVKKLDTSTLRNIATSDAVQNVTISTTIMSYYVNIASDTPANIIYLATNSGGMTVDNIVVQRLGSYDDSWVVEGIVKKVDESRQNEYFAWGINDIRGVKVSADTQWLNTYSTANWMNRAPIRLPLAPSKNNIALLRDEPMLVGYDLYMDISTIGDYYENNASMLQVIPYYYVIDLDQKHVDPIPVDGYLKYSKGYYPVNIFGLVTGQNKNVITDYEGYNDMTMDDVYNFAVNLDWINEQSRRNYTDVERYQTETLQTILFEFNNGIQRNIFTPLGHDYIQGNPQFLQLNGKARTFNGGETTYGQLMNLGGSDTITVADNGRKYNIHGRVNADLWWQKGQRWHFTLGVPSSTIFVRQGVEPTSDTIEEFRKSNYIILCCADIRAIGETWQLRYSHVDKNAYGSTHGEVGPGDNGSIQVTTRDGATITYPIPDYLPPAIAVYSTVKSSEFDISIVGVH